LLFAWVEFRALLSGTGDTDGDVFVHDRPAAARTVLLHITVLNERVLTVVGGVGG
jgi:hypothetical protein